jgi:glycosyltransferase involved in cell wall biosynthesis
MIDATFRQFIPYFEHARVRITFVAGNTFVPLTPRHANEVLIVRDAWYPSNPETDIRRLRKIWRPQPGRVHFLSNTEEIHQLRLKHGFESHYVNVGCFIDTEIFRPPAIAPEKKYDAVMNARFTKQSWRAVMSTLMANARVLSRKKSGFDAWLAFVAGARLHRGGDRELKRHWLTTHIPNLALLDPFFESNEPAYRKKYGSKKNCSYLNVERLPPEDVARVISESHVGLALSSWEGVCRASCETLACGIPVVSTSSFGGRDVWYDDANSSVVAASPRAIARAVMEQKSRKRDPQPIRSGFLARAEIFKKRFRDEVLTPILTKYGVDMSADEVMRTNPFRWWL